VLAILCVASAVVSQVIEVPGLLTNGKAWQVRPPAHGVSSKLPLTHCANWPLTQAFWPGVQGELAVSVANCAFSFCAASPLDSAKLDFEAEDAVAGVDAAGAGAAELGAGVASLSSDEGAAADEPALLDDEEAEPESELELDPEEPGTPGLVVISVN